MLRPILVVLGIPVIITSYSVTAYAQSSPTISNSSVTLSGNSLRAVEGRGIVRDYQNFFNGTLPTSQPISVTNVGRITTSQQRPMIGNQPAEVVGDNLNPDFPLLSFPARSDGADTEKVKLQLQLGNQ